jgi:hypothetical protein
MAAMTSKERLTRCFHNLETDRPGIYSRTAFPAGDPSYDDLKKLLIEKTDLKSFWWGYDLKEYDLITSMEPYREGYVRLNHRLPTPLGDLASSYVKCLEGSDGAVTEYFLKDEHDVEKYLSLPMPDVKVDISYYNKALKDMGDRGVVTAYLGNCPGGYAAELCGSETFAVLSVTHRDLLHELCERRKRIIMMLLKELRKHHTGYLFSMQGEEYITPPIHGKKDFYDFIVRYDKEIIGLIHDMGGRIHIHSHGSIKTVMDGFIEMGTDVLHPFEAPPFGDMTTREAKEKASGRICMEGNIEISYMYEKTPEEIGFITEKLVEEAFYDGKGLIASPTASPYIYGKGDKCIKQYEALVNTVINVK